MLSMDEIFQASKEFFGDDPKIATKNLPADAVETVQVFDKKSSIDWMIVNADADNLKSKRLYMVQH